MHIAFLTPEYPHPDLSRSGGLGTSIKNLAHGLVVNNIKVTVFVSGQITDKIFEDDGFKLISIAKKQHLVFNWFFERKRLQRYIQKHIDKEGIHLIEVPDWTGLSAFMKFSVPIVIRFHGSDAYFCKLEGRKQKYKNFILEKLALKSASAYITPTNYTGNETQNIFGLDKHKIKTIHHGLILENFKNNDIDNYNRHTLLYLGTIIRKKGVLELAKIFNKVIELKPDAQLIIIGNDAPDIKTGESSTFKLMENICSQNAKRQLSYFGKIPYDEVIQHINNAHVCAFPSFAETLGMVTIEAMAMQKPVVNTNIGWAQELIDDGVNGFLVHPMNIEGYANRIIDLFDNESLCKEIGIAARQKVEIAFDINKQALKNVDFYKSLIEP